MGRRPHPELKQARAHLGTLIETGLNDGQRGNGTRQRSWRPWTNTGFADKVAASESDVRGWRNANNPVRPANILPILRVLYGDIPGYAEARKNMLIACRRAGGIRSEESAPPPIRAIESKQFSDVAEIVDLCVSQPTPDNTGNLIVPFTLRIHPDTNREVDGNAIEIGVTESYFVVDSEHWLPAADTVFRGKAHPNTRSVATRGAVKIVQPADDEGRIDGQPLESEPRLILEPRNPDRDGPIEVSIRVAREGFKVTPRGQAEVTGTQKAVLDGLFADAFPRDKKSRLKVASETVRSRAAKVTE
jgi:hypothetical protein